MVDAALILVIGFIFFGLLLLGLALFLGYWFIFRGKPLPKSIKFKPGDIISIKPAYEGAVFGSHDYNETKYFVSGPERPLISTLCSKKVAAVSSPKNVPCNQTSWVYNKDKTLSPSYDSSLFINGTNPSGACPRQTLNIGEKNGITWNFDTKRGTWCQTDNTTKCMRIFNYLKNTVGVTIGDLPDDFDKLSSKDKAKVAFQWVVTKPLTTNTNITCKG